MVKFLQQQQFCLQKADRILNESHISLTEKMTDFFENSEHAETLAQWRGKYENRLKQLKDDSYREAKKQCECIKYTRECHHKLEEIHKHHRQQLLKQIQELVAESKQNKTLLTRLELEKRFDKKWQLWMSELYSEEYQSMYASNEVIRVTIHEILLELLGRHSGILRDRLKQFPLMTKEPCDMHMSIKIDINKHLKSDHSNWKTAGNSKFLTKIRRQPSWI